MPVPMVQNLQDTKWHSDQYENGELYLMMI